MTDTNEHMAHQQHFIFDSLPSTNSKMKELAEEGKLPEMAVVQTTHQYAGRGQMGNHWESQSGKNLTFSFYIRPKFVEIESQFMLSKITSLAIAKAISTLGINDIKIKWPNDIYYQNKKLAGILIETSIMGRHMYDAIIGVGLNVNQTVFQSNAPNPISLKNISGKTYNITDLLNTILNDFVLYYNRLKQNQSASINKEYIDLLFRFGETCKYKDENDIYNGKITGVDSTGRLKITTEQGLLNLYNFKEVEFII